MPAMNLRLISPELIVDIGDIAELRGIAVTGDTLRIGALTRHVDLQNSPEIAAHLPLLTQAIAHVAHPAIRNRGTIGGSLSHADPAAELPMLALLLNAELHIASINGSRVAAARDFFIDTMTVDLDGTELLAEIVLPKPPPHTGWGFEEVARRHGDFALAAVATTLTLSGDRIAQARIALTGVGPTALRATAAETLLTGQRLDDKLTLRAIAAVREAISPETDLHASADYRRHLAGVLAGRALAAAWRRAKEGA
jgi:carbon-monoxide dehydrogenase medium subunit